MTQVTERTLDEWIAEREAVHALMPEGKPKVLDARDIQHVKNNRRYLLHGTGDTTAYFCKECGTPERATYVDDYKKPMLEKGICFCCELWSRRLADHLKKPTVIFDGVMYSIGPEPKKGENRQFLGFGGAGWFLRDLNTGKVTITHNLWCGGDIPKRFIEAGMRDTHVSITQQEALSYVS